MKRARNYIYTIRRALNNWTEWMESGNEMLADGDKQFLLGWVEHETAKLKKLDAQDVEDAILQHEEGIDWRLKRLDDFQLLPVIEFIQNTKDTPAQMADAEVNETIGRYRQLIEAKALDLIRVVRECERYIKPQNPIIKKALENPLLLSYFYNNKKVLEEYINYCLSDTNKSQKAVRAMELAGQGKVRKDVIKKPLHDALKKVGINVGENPNWNEAINKYLLTSINV